MTWSTVPAIVAGVPVPKVTWFDVVTGDLNVLGGAWTADPRATSAIWTTTGAALGTGGTLISRYRLTGKTLDWLVLLTLGTSGFNAGSTSFTFAYPASVAPLNPGASCDATIFDSSASGTYAGKARILASTVTLECITSAAGLMGFVNATAPMTWAASDFAGFLMTGCEVA